VAALVRKLNIWSTDPARQVMGLLLVSLLFPQETKGKVSRDDPVPNETSFVHIGPTVSIPKGT